MLEDITKNTKWVLDQFIPENKPTNSKHYIYDLYRKLWKVTQDVNLVANHYLALDFTEGYLQDSSLGSPSDKWRYFFNEDLETLNKSLQSYLMKLNNIASEGAMGALDSYLSSKYNAKSFYGFVRDEYNVGMVKPCGFEMICTILKTDKLEEESPYISKFVKIDLSTYEQRVALQNILNEKNEILKKERLRLKEYMQKNFTLEDLL